MAELDMFIPLVKVDEEQRLVYGIATAEDEDNSGEICDYASTKPYYEKWSGEMAKASDGKNLGNIRVMHGKVAAGKITKLLCNDDARQIEICAKVVDDNEWNKVLEGVYTGFSQGGSYVRKWKDPDTGKTRYTARPSEVSLVDRPCLKRAAFFQIQKMDGTLEKREFALPSEEELEQDIEDMLMLVSREVAVQKFDDGDRWSECLDDAERGILETFSKYSEDQPRDSSGKWAAAAVGAAIGGAKGAVLGALTAGQAGAIVGGVSGAISGAMETSDSKAVRAGGQVLEAVTSAVGVGHIASRMLQARSAVNAAVSGAKAVVGAAEAGKSASEAARELTDPAARGHAEQMLDRARDEAMSQFEAAQSDVERAKTQAQKNFDAAVKRQAAKMKSDTKATEARSKLKSVSGGKKDAEKADSTGDLKKMDITNEMVFDKAKELATAAGDVGKFGDYIATARETLEKGDTQTEETLEKTEEVAKKNDDWGVEQVWQARDGSTHKKKSDALAKNAEIQAGDSDIVRKLDAALGKTADGTETARSALAKYVGEEVWDTRRAVEALGTVFDLLSREGAESEPPEQAAALKKAISGLKEFIVSEIQEDNSDPVSRVMALADSIGNLAKSGARNSKADLEMIQTIHDHACALGCTCTPAEKSDDSGDLAKRAALLDAIEPRLEALLKVNEDQAEQIRKQGEQISLLSKAAAPPPRLTVAEKSGEITISGSASEQASLEKIQKEFDSLDQDQKALLMMKFAQSRPQPMSARD